VARGTGVIGGALITALVAVVPAAAEAQTYAITVDSGTHFLKASVSEVGCSSEYRSDSEYKPISFSGAFYVLPELPLHFSDGKWLPATASYTGIGSIGTADSNSTITTTLSAGGIVTGSEFGSIAGLAPGTIMGSSTLDLNTGAFTFARTITRTVTNSPCRTVTIETQDRRAVLPIRKTLVPPPSRRIILTNPYDAFVHTRQGPTAVTAQDAWNAPVARGLAGDGATAVVVAFRSTQQAPVSFSLTAPNLGTACCGIGSLAPFDPQYLSTIAPASGPATLTVAQPSFCDAGATPSCVYLALLWAPAEVPVSATDLFDGRFPAVELIVRATQPSSVALDASVHLMPPPLLLVHGVWSDATAAWTGFYNWLRRDSVHHYPHQLIGLVDYGPQSHTTFRAPLVQQQFADKLASVLSEAAVAGIAARRVDVVAHSMGGLVTRYFLENTLKSIHYLPARPVREFITIGTPHTGSKLAEKLWAHQNDEALFPGSILLWDICINLIRKPCTLSNVLAWRDKIVDTAVEHLQTGLPSDNTDYRAIVGHAPGTSTTETALDFIVGGFLAPQTVDSILGPQHDTIVHESSQRAEYAGTSRAREIVSLPDIVHTALAPWNDGETSTPAVWRQVLYWLMGGKKASPQPITHSNALTEHAEPATPPLFDLTGYTPAAPSAFSVSPVTGSTLTINEPASIVATSTTKTLVQFLLFQTATSPSDATLLYASAAPFSVAFRPTRLGTAEFLAVAVFSDQTYATKVLTYTLQPFGAVVTLLLRDAPAPGIEIGSTVTVSAEARFANNAAVDVTQVATYAARSGTSTVFAIAAGGIVTATGFGVDWLDVSYGGKTTSARIAVGACTYTLGPSNQMAPVGGGAVTIDVLTQPGCVWSANRDDSWVSLTSAAKGLGPGAFSVTVAANTSQATRLATISAGTGRAVITQPATACTYTGLPAQVALPAAGGTGSIPVTTSCLIVPSTSAPWLTVLGSSSPIVYTAPANPLGVSRSALVTIGVQSVTFIQAANTAIPPTSGNPFGVVDTPIDNRTGVTGAVPFTGWALDDVAVTRVAICRDAFGAEVAPIDPNCGGAAQIFIGFASIIEGARPDVARAFPSYPQNTRAGWGFMVLTNMLPNQGNGVYRFTMWAVDSDAHAVVIGTRTMTCANASATLPFGAIDTPMQGGGSAGAAYVNFGWALTPQPKMIPIDGSTMQVLVDGVAVGNVNYNHERSDITALFPGFLNTLGAVGFHILDTTKMLEGLHTISWSVTDDQGATEGIGSRFFRVTNSVSGALAVVDSARTDREVESAPLDTSTVLGRVGWNLRAPLRRFGNLPSGQLVVRSEEVGRLELALATSENRRGEWSGYSRTARGLTPLPIGSHLDTTTGMFTWAPGVGFIGTYDLVFLRAERGEASARREVRIILLPNGSEMTRVQVVIDAPTPQQRVAQPFIVGGWAADLNATSGTGLSTLHAWAFPAAGGSPIFLGALAYGGARPDVGAVHGDQFRESGFGLTVQGLAPGTYDLAVFAWSLEIDGFTAPKLVRFTVSQ
jgi:hypothetical protein